MYTLNSEIEAARTQLGAEKVKQPLDYRRIASHLETLAGLFLRVSRDGRRQLIAQFHNSAGILPYLHDRDFGALLLERAAEAVADTELRLFLLREARFRVEWCVQAATAAGESLARVVHMQRLDEKIQQAGEHAGPNQ